MRLSFLHITFWSVILIGFAFSPLAGHAKESVLVANQADHLGIDQSSIFFDSTGVNNLTVCCQNYRSRKSAFNKFTVKHSPSPKLKRLRLDSTPDQLALVTQGFTEDVSKSPQVQIEPTLSPRHLVNFWSREPL